jgi:hypothetical protein
MTMLIQIALLLTAASQPAPNPGEHAPIVVTGERISDLRAALAACLARNCPTNEDVDASLALAEGEFLNGAYDRSEQAIRASIERNRQHRRAFAEPVADLYRSQARVQSHRGRDQLAAQSTYETLRTLRAGLPQEDHRHFTARLEIVQMELRNGNQHGAARELRELEAAARRAGRDDLVRLANMRQLQLRYALAPFGVARRRLLELAESRDPGLQFESVSARLFLARALRQEGEIARSDQLLAGIPPSDNDRRALLYAPPIELTERLAWYSNDTGQGNALRLLADDYRNKWIDVGYWIDRDGRVGDVEILRQGARTEWAEPLLRSVRGRIYAPSGDGASSYRLERYTYTAPFQVVTGSRIPQRSRRARVEYLDLTNPGEPGRAPETGIAPERPTR